ncbi:uncharacterized protein LOC124286721 [Haliotis rubra]|uniref:uncharacterized protein LOC124286721 n=1 Tax=Haliotis rubra TaxID=36100 RepID=UPI001EE56A11|nr:uncharacterized protein LOC124286721 [Haliotis rubra]
MFYRHRQSFPPTSKYKLTLSSTMDIKTCRDHCLNLGFRYASAKLAVECTCGNSVNIGARVRESSCNLQCRGDNSESCGGTRYHSIYRTSDNVCSATMPRDPSDPLRCYTTSLHQLDWYTGRFSCGRNRGDLVSIQSVEKQAFLAQNVYPEPASFAEKVSIGVYQQNHSHFNYYDVDNNVTANWKYFFTNWNGNNGGDLDCAMSDVHTGEWIHGKCGTASIKSNFVCEYKQKRRTVTGNIWRRLETALEKPSTSVTTNAVVNRNDIAFSHDTKLYADDLDLGCLNNHELCPNGFTFVFWIFIDSQATSDMEILSTGSCVSQFAVGVGVCVYYAAASNNIVINDATNTTFNRVARLTVGKGSWHHVALVFDGGTTMYTHLDGGRANEFTVDTSLTTTLTSTLIYEQTLFGNWHDVSAANDSFKLYDVRFKPQKMMWKEINGLYGGLKPTTGSVHWLQDDTSTVRKRRHIQIQELMAGG